MGLTLRKALGDYDSEAEDIGDDLVVRRMRPRDELEEVMRRRVRFEQECRDGALFHGGGEGEVR